MVRAGLAHSFGGSSRPCSREVAPVVRPPAGSGEAPDVLVQVSRAGESSTLSLPPPQSGFLTQCQATEGHHAMGRPECLGQGTLTGWLLMPDNSLGRGYPEAAV